MNCVPPWPLPVAAAHARSTANPDFSCLPSSAAVSS
jgi:hypothetical protein